MLCSLQINIQCFVRVSVSDYSIGFLCNWNDCSDIKSFDSIPINQFIWFTFWKHTSQSPHLATPYGFKKIRRIQLSFVKKTLLLNSQFLPEWWCVVANDDQFCFALTQWFQRLFVSQAVFAGFHYQSQTGIGAFQSFFLHWEKENRKKIGKN